MRAPLLLVLASLLLPGCATPGGGEEDPGEIVEAFVRMAPRGMPGSYVEVNVDMEEGAEASWRFNSSAPLRWDVHTHDGNRVETLDNGTSAEASGSFRAPRNGTYSLFLVNADPKNGAGVTYRVQGAFKATPSA